MRQKAIGLAVLAAILIAGVAGTLWYNKSQSVMAEMQGAISAELSNALGCTVSIDRVEIASANRIILTGVRVQDDQGEPLAASKQVSVVFNLFSVVSGKSPLSAVKELTLDEPVVDLRRAPDGQWNAEKLWNRNRSQDSVFEGKISLSNGSVTIATTEGNWRVTDIGGTLDFVHKAGAAVDISGVYDGGGIKAKGTVSEKGASALDIEGESLVLDSFQAVIPAELAVKPLSGRVETLQLLVRREQGVITVSGQAKLDGVAADVTGVVVRDVQGQLAFTNNQVYFLGTTAKVGNQEFELKGKISTDTTDPALDLAVVAKHLDLAALGQEVPLTGIAQGSALVSGTAANPVVSGELRLPQGRIDAYDVTAARIRFDLSGGVATIHELSAEMFGGQVTATGTLDIASRYLRGNASGRNLDLAAIPGLPFSLAGKGDLDLRLEGPARLNEIQVAGTAKIAGGSAEGVTFAQAEAGFYRTADQLVIDYLTVDFNPGILTAQGAIVNDRVALNFFGQGVPLAAIAGSGGLNLSGAADLDGRVSGPASDPLVEVQFTARNGQAFYQPFALAKGSLAATRNSVSLQGVEVVSSVGRHTVDGTIGLTGPQEVNLHVATQGARAENLVKLILPGEELTGNVDNDMVLTGSLSDLEIEGRIKLYEGSFRGQLLSCVEGAYRRQHGVTELNGFTVSALNAQLRFDGTVEPGNELNLAITARDVDLASLQFHYPYPVAGRISLDGKLTGTPTQPLFAGAISAKTLTLNGQELQNIDGRISIAGSKIDIQHFGFNQNGGQFAFAGGIDSQSNAVYGDLTAQKGSVASLLAVLNVAAKDLDGRLDGSISVSGTLDKPNVWLTGTLTDGKIKNYPLESIDVDVALENGLITVNRFFARQGSGVLVVQGTAALEGPLNLEVGGRDLDAGLLTAWLDSNLDTRGKLAFTAQISGTMASPHAAVSLDISGGGVANATFDSLYGLFILDQGRINVNQLMLSKGPYKASAYGTIPLGALSREGRAQATKADQMDLKVKLEQANLSILPMLTKEVSWASGETKGEVTIGGTLDQPLINGGILVRDGTVKLASLKDPIQKVGVDIQFEGDKINVKSFDGSMGAGSYRLAGTAGLNGLALADYNFLLVLDKLDVSHKYYNGPLNGTLALASSNGKPKLSGKLIFENTTANIPSIPEFASSDLDVGLDVEVLVQNKVRLYNPYLYDLWLEGRIKLAGTTLAPDVSGRLTAVRGSVDYLQTRFKVLSATADFVRPRTLIPIIHLNSETRLELTKVSMTVNGPLDAMEVHLSSQPSMSQKELVSLLTLRGSYAQGGADGGRDGLGREEVLGLLNTGLQMRFMAEAEAAFRNAFGLDEFRLIRGTMSEADSKSDRAGDSDREVYNLEVSKYVTDRLYLSYNMGLDHKEYTASFRYDLNRVVSFTGSVDEQNRRKVGIETRFYF